MRKKYQENLNECKKLEAKVASLRKKQNIEKSIVALDNLLEIQRSPLDKSSLGLQKGESSLHVRKDIKEDSKKPVANNTSRKTDIQGNKK